MVNLIKNKLNSYNYCFIDWLIYSENHNIRMLNYIKLGINRFMNYVEQYKSSINK
jgi:hypothetical protein